jgi:hypothetical protein
MSACVCLVLLLVTAPVHAARRWLNQTDAGLVSSSPFAASDLLVTNASLAQTLVDLGGQLAAALNYTAAVGRVDGQLAILSADFRDTAAEVRDNSAGIVRLESRLSASEASILALRNTTEGELANDAAAKIRELEDSVSRLNETASWSHGVVAWMSDSVRALAEAVGKAGIARCWLNETTERVECACRAGYTGPACESDVKECASSPCRNGASCVDKVDRFECVCAAGWTGRACETNLVTQWGCWGVCEGTCGQPGVRRRMSSVPAGLEDRMGCESPCFPEWRNLTAAGRAGFMDALRKWVAPSGCHREGEERVTTFGSTSQSYQEGTLAPNGMIYIPPLGTGQFLKIDPSWDVVSVLGPSTSGYLGSALAPNGDVYAIPFDATSIARIRTATDTVSLFGSFGTGTKWVGGVLAPNGCVYGMPRGSTGVLRINTNADTFSIIGSVTPLADAYHDGVLAPNGLVYGIPWYETRVLVVDPQTDQVWYMPDLGHSGWVFGVMDVNGVIFSLPHMYAGASPLSQGILRVNAAESLSEILLEGSGTVFRDYSGGALAPTGKLFFAPSDTAAGVLRLDSATMQWAKLGSASGYRCPVLAPNGTLYMSPFNTGNVLKVDFPYLPAMALPLDALLSPFLN